MKIFTIYLAGYIAGGDTLKKCIGWRHEIRDYFYKNPKWHSNIKILDPLCGKNLETISFDGNKSDLPDRAFMLRDYHGVKQSDLIIANLDTFGCERPSLGTTYELAWSWEFRIPVIIIGTDKNYIEHPFIKETAVAIFPTVEALLESKLINYYFKGNVSAE